MASKTLRRDRRPRGVNKPMAKLTDAMVREARWLHTHRGITVQALSEKYGVGRSTIDQAIRGVTWSHVKTFEELGVVPDIKFPGLLA